jgi:hypothetical protein
VIAVFRQRGDSSPAPARFCLRHNPGTGASPGRTERHVLLLSPACAPAQSGSAYRDGFWTRVAAAGTYQMPTDLRKVAHLGSRVETTREHAPEVIVYLSEVHEFDLMLVEVVDDAGRTTHV